MRQTSKLDAFRRYWSFVRGLSLTLLGCLTNSELSYTPGASLGPFWKQFRHVGGVQECYMEALTTGKIRFAYQDKHYHGGTSKDALLTYLQALDEELLELLQRVDWSQSIDWDSDSPDVYEHLMRLVRHEVLHHGEWIVYIRLMRKDFPESWEAYGV